MEELSFIKAALLGVLQGLTEFLPVSSSGHILLLSEIFGLSFEGATLTTFTILLHAGTLLALLVIYFKRVIALFAHPVKGELKWLIVATLPTVVFALLLKVTGWDEAVDAGERTLLPFAFLLTAVFMVLSDAFAKSYKQAKKTHKNVGFKDALKMGLMQCVGTFSGVSRSGSTITGGLASGLTSKSAADFSFMMAIPAVCGSVVLEAWDWLKDGGGIGALEGSYAQVAVGVLVSFIVGLLAIKFMLAVIKKAKLKWFALYLVLLAALILVNDYAYKIW